MFPGGDKEVAQGVPSRRDYIFAQHALFARVVDAGVDVVVHAQLGDNAPYLLGGVEEQDLFERFAAVGAVVWL